MTAEVETPDEKVATTDADRIDPQPEHLTLSTGLEVDVVPLKMRELFMLLRIVTRGGAEILSNMRLSLQMEEDEFVAQFVALIFFAVPEAIEETREFLQAMCRPSALTGNKKADAAVWEEFGAAFDNPEIEDAIDIIERIVKNEAGDILALGKRLRTAFNMAERTGQIPTETPAASKKAAAKTKD
jgi:hypothetical protein